MACVASGGSVHESGFSVRKDAYGALDFLALGSLVHRLDPGVVPFRKGASVDVHVSGGEYNVAANSSDCFRPRTGVAAASGRLPHRRTGAGPRPRGRRRLYKWFAHDGVRGPNIATVYSDRGHGVRAPVVFYNRANEAGALLKPGDFDWEKIHAGGVRWFHSGGIFAALSETTAELILEGMRAAKVHGAVNSFDLNYRAKLWSAAGGLGRAQQVLRRIVGQVDALIGNEEDLQKGLGIAGPEVGSRSKLDPDTFFLMIDRVVEQFPNVKMVGTTLREVHSTNRHDWAAVLWLDGQRFVSPTCPLDVMDRIGGGDGFASWPTYGLICRLPEEAASPTAHAPLTTYPGDVTMARLEEVEALAKGGSARVQR